LIYSGKEIQGQMVKNATRQRRGISAEVPADVSALINTTLSEVLEGYASGAMQWCQRFRPDLVNGLATIEAYVNELAQAGDAEGVRGALARYRRHLEEMVKVFKAGSGKTGSLF
jgi:hypothetical protein